MASSGLIIRRDERHEISLDARARISFAHQDAVRFARGVAGDEGWFDIHLIDFSIAGTGFMSELFLPKGVTLEIQIPDPRPDLDAPVLSAVVRVKRVQMTDRRPAYLIGSAFTDLDDATEAQVESVMRMLGSEGSDPEGTDHA